ncbi:MAG: hypothetical protein WDO56_27850 [Gammaproteobacteria bacterium]
MYLFEDLFEAMQDPSLRGAQLQRFAELEATLAEFVTSRNLDPQYVFLLTPTKDGIWEIRSARPEPQIRVFGFFADRDAFVATNYEFRSTLGEYNSKEWQFAMARAKSIWRRLFEPLLPRYESDPKLLITGAIDGKYFLYRS